MLKMCVYVCVNFFIYCMSLQYHPVVICVENRPLCHFMAILSLLDTAALQYFLSLSLDENLVCPRIKKN